MGKKMSAAERALANSKLNIPLRSSRIAEEYAEKVRMEPPKATRQEMNRTAADRPTTKKAA